MAAKLISQQMGNYNYDTGIHGLISDELWQKARQTAATKQTAIKTWEPTKTKI